MGPIAVPVTSYPYGVPGHQQRDQETEASATMPVRMIPWKEGGSLALPPGLVVLQVRNAAQNLQLHEALLGAIADDAGVPIESGRLCWIEVGDALLATHADAAIRAAHWRTLLACLPTISGEDSTGLKARISDLQNEIAREESRQIAAASDAAAESSEEDEFTQLLQQRERIDSEIRREMRGLIEIPDAARQVIRLGESQATIRGDYMRAQELRKELEGRLDTAAGETRRLKQEEGRKSIFGVVFMFLGLISLFAQGVPAHLKPLGFVVIALGAAFTFLANKNANAKESPKEANLRRQAKELEARLLEIDERLKEADRQVRQFCASVGCTSPGQVLELQRRYDQRLEDRALVEEKIQMQRPVEDRNAASGGGVALAVEHRLSLLRTELHELERELQRKSAVSQLRRPSLAIVLESANSYCDRWLGKDAVRWRVSEDQSPVLAPEKGISLRQKVLTYLALRVGLIGSCEENPSNLPLVLDDPLKLWDDEELADGFEPLAGLARHNRQVIYTTSRGAMLSAWRQASRSRDEVLTVIALGHSPAD